MVVAQLGEHLSGRQEVASSILANYTIISGIRTVWLLHVIWDHEIAGSNPAFRTILELVLISLLWEPLFAGSSPAFSTIIGK